MVAMLHLLSAHVNACCKDRELGSLENSSQALRKIQRSFPALCTPISALSTFIVTSMCLVELGHATRLLFIKESGRKQSLKYLPF